MIYHFGTEATKGYNIHAYSAFANYQGSFLPERRALIERYMLSDIAFNAVGVGSVGTFCAIGLAQTKHDHAQLKAAIGTRAGLASK